MEYESSTEAATRKAMVARRRTEAQNQLNCEKAFINELANKYDYVKMDKYMKANIKKKLLFDLNKFEPQSYVNNLCIQVETLYIFSILKSLLFSQFLDENVQKIVARYRIKEIEVPPAPYYALKSYELKGSPVEKMLSKEDARDILKKYSLLGRQCYIDVLFKLKTLNDFVINSQLFAHPLNYKIIYPVIQYDPEYKGNTFEEVYQSASDFPVELKEYIKVWHAISKSFKKNTIEANWCGGIIKVVQDLIYEKFDSKNIVKDLSQNRLNPFIIKLLEV